ncbi:MAG: iron-sulfur cluster assembly accessory protein [Acidobacteria bacterium]|nr:iron-sulfur cluster assembly accessory protein [Acidobacteriota bacterium]
MAIEITPRAAQQIKELMRKQSVPEGGLRVGVKGGGCSGLMYTMDIETQARPGDKIFEADGVKVFCDLKSYLYLNNMTLDYSESLMSKGFVFSNPNATRTCGCGQSFS